MIDTSKLLREILVAYDAQQLRPTRGTFFTPEGYACPIVALALHRGVVSRDNPDLSLERATNPAFDWGCTVFGEDFTFGLLDGFDGKSAKCSDPPYLGGFGLGTALARLLFPVSD
jgi:hypothetical protein